jgi:L,D-transpeptidase catalytic domain
MTFLARLAGLGVAAGALVLVSCPNAQHPAAVAAPCVSVAASPVAVAPKPVAPPRAAPSSPTPPPAPERADAWRLGVDPAHTLAALAAVTFVYEKPDWRSTKFGYLRAGAIVQRADKPAGYSACHDGWYRVRPEGYVCVGKMATTDVSDPVVRAAHHSADRDAPLPYRYGMSRFPTPPLYNKIPSLAEQRAREPDLARHLAQVPKSAWADVPVEPLPDFLQNGGALPAMAGEGRDASVTNGHALPRSGFAFLKFFESGGRKFGLSTDLQLIPLDRVKPVVPSAFHGLLLDKTTTLPVVFVMHEGALLYDGAPATDGLKIARPLAYREALPITGKSARVGARRYLQTTDGQWLADDHLVRVDPMHQRPGWATPGRSWIDVSILKQTLIAYLGTEPEYVTLVSTGADGLGDPKTTHSTIRGVFLIHTKHVSVTMSGDDVGDEFNLRDVPYVQYFTQGYALHAAYWHDAFGQPHSHGCINLSPIDAEWLFNWTDPPVPRGWHGAMSLRDGTLVSVHP